MQITNRIVDNGTTVGYIIEDGKFTLPMCKKALYLEMYISPLIQAGYKYYGYEADNIEDPTGTPISQHPAISRDDIDELEWAASIELAMTSALSDAEASKYYTFREESAYKFKTEPSYEINTREEFIDYLERLKKAFYNLGYVSDNRPINFFVNPDALFSIDELENNAEYRKYFDIIVKRHHFRNYGAYVDIVDWLCERGVLNTKTPTTAEFLAAYYAWGPEGIKDKCVSFETKLNVDGIFQFSKDPLSSVSETEYLCANRSKKVTVIDGRENVQRLKIRENISDIVDAVEFKRSRIAMIDNNDLMLCRRRNTNGKKYYPTISTYVSDVSDRLYITLISENGYTYCYKVSHDKIKLGLMHTNSNSALFYYTENFMFASVFAGLSIPFDTINSNTDYYLWNFAAVKAMEIINEKSKKAPASSTSDFLIRDGVNPIAVCDIIAHSITTKGGLSYASNTKYALEGKDETLCNALEVYLTDIPDYILSAYCLTRDDVGDSVEAFLELADVDDLLDRREQMISGGIQYGQTGFDETFKITTGEFAKQQQEREQILAMRGIYEKKVDAVDYYTKLKFVYNCLHDGVTVDNFGDGVLEDLKSTYSIAIECIMSVIYAEYGNDVDRKIAEDAITNITNTDLIDIYSIFRTRDAAYNGYMVDFAKYRKTRACSNTWVWAYCTKVFREISNAPVEKQRPYLMELVVVENNKTDQPIRDLMAAIVRESILKAGLSKQPLSSYGVGEDWSEEACALESAEFVGAQLFFFICAGGVKNQPVNGVYHVNFNIYDGKDLDIEIPVDVYNFIRGFNRETHKRYITVYDYCKYEYNPNTGAGTFNMFLVNAIVDPWHVKPKRGYSIKSYPLMPNYYDSNALDSANGVGFYTGGCNSKAIVVSPLKGTYRDLFIPTSEIHETVMYENQVMEATTCDELYDFLVPSTYEYIFAYVRRWAMEMKKAKSMGKKLVSIPLKQDIVYASLAESYCDEVPPTTAVYSDDVSFDNTAFRSNIDVGNISWRQYFDVATAIETKQVTIRELSVKDLNCYEASLMAGVLSGEWNSPVPITVTGNYINVKGDTLFRVAVSKLTQTQIDEFASEGILIKLGEGKYCVHAMNGEFILEVKQ